MIRNDRGEFPIGHLENSQPYRPKAIAVAIVIILGLGGLVVAGVGLSGYLGAGSLSHLGKLNCIIMMSLGGAGCTTFIISVIIASVKNHLSNLVIESEEARRQLSIEAEKEFIKITSTEATATSLRGDYYFGKKLWKDCFGRDVEAEPPQEMVEFLKSPCSFLKCNKEITNSDVFMAFFVPKDLTLKEFKDLKKTNNPSIDTIFLSDPLIECSFAAKDYNTCPIEKSYWCVMTRHVIPHSKSRTFSEQEELVKKYTGDKFEIPDVLEATIGIMGEFRSSSHYLFYDNRTYNTNTVTRCIDTINGHQLTVGGMCADSLNIEVDENPTNRQLSHGMAVVRRFY